MCLLYLCASALGTAREDFQNTHVLGCRGCREKTHSAPCEFWLHVRHYFLAVIYDGVFVCDTKCRLHREQYRPSTLSPRAKRLVAHPPGQRLIPGLLPREAARAKIDEHHRPPQEHHLRPRDALAPVHLFPSFVNQGYFLVCAGSLIFSFHSLSHILVQ